MKKKIIYVLSAIAVFCCIFAISASAATIYKDATGNEMFRFEMNSSNIITSYKGEFPKTDASGNALTWYVISTATDADNNTVKTVASVQTLDPQYFTLADGNYEYGGTAGKPVTQYNVVSVNFPHNSGILKLILENEGYKASGYSYSPFTTELLFLYLPNTLTSLPGRTIQNSKALVCDMPSDMPIKGISNVEFYHAKCLRKINIPSTVETINGKGAGDGSAFYQCVSLEKVTFGENSELTEIQYMAFCNCTSLSEILIPDSVLTIGEEAFLGTAIVNSPFSKNSQCHTIGANAFQGIKTLKSMIIPNGIVNLNVMTFMAYCENIEFIGFGNNPQLKTISANCFNGWSVRQGKNYGKLNIEVLPDQVTSVGDFAFMGTAIVNSPFSVNSQCTFIGHEAFYVCEKLKEINIPKNATFVTDLSEYPSDQQKAGVFFGCISLESVSFHEDTAVKVLPPYMFALCSSLTYVKIPNSVTTLSARMFDRCTSLETLILGASLTGLNNGRAYSDGHNSFTYGCTALKYVYMSKTLDMSTGHSDACHVFTTKDYNGKFAYLTMFVNGNYDDAARIKNGFVAVSSCNANDRITNAEIISLAEYEALAEVTKNYLVYDVNTCDAFYDSKHTNIDNDCQTPDICGRNCGKTIPSHSPISNKISYADYTANGTRVVVCEYDGCNGSGTFVLEPIFSAVGYSIKQDGYGIISSYMINVEALKDFEEVNGKLVFGIIMANANFDNATEFMTKNSEGEYILNSKYGIQLEVNNRDFAKINSTIDRFTQSDAELQLVMALYVVDDDGIQYIQREGSYVGTVTKGETTLDIVTISKIAEINEVTLPFIVPSNQPTGNEENN